MDFQKDLRIVMLEAGQNYGYIFPCTKCDERLVICGVLYRAYMAEMFDMDEQQTAREWKKIRDGISLSTAFSEAGTENKMCRKCFDEWKAR